MIRKNNVVALLKLRISKGAYRHSGLPAERELADEIGVARMTARKALAQLEADKFAVRLDTGRLVLADNVKQKKQIAMLIPSLASYGIKAWVNDAKVGAEDLDVYVRPIFYDSYDDIILTDTLQRADGIFFVPRAEEMPPWVAKSLIRHPKVFVLENDMSGDGIPSLTFFNPATIHLLLKHLHQLGHKRVDLVNNQGRNQAIEMRITQWQEWKELFDVKGECLDLFALAGNHYDKQKQALHSYLSPSKDRPSSMVCTSLESALLLLRVSKDLGLTPGKDISICLMDGESHAATYAPSITALERPDSSRYLKRCMEWMANEKAAWKGPLRMDILGVELFVGETTGPAPA